MDRCRAQEYILYCLCASRMHHVPMMHAQQITGSCFGLGCVASAALLDASMPSSAEGRQSTAFLL